MQEFTSKKISQGSEAQDKLAEGARLMAEVVGSTMGPNGKLVCYNSPYHLWPMVTKDGVTVAREVLLDDPELRLGADMVNEAANRQVDESGDGTTLTSVLAYEILHQGLKLVRAGANPHAIRKGIDFGVNCIVRELQEMATPLNKTPEDYAKIATIACNGDIELGALIGKAVYDVGDYGVVTYAKGVGIAHELIQEKGYHWDKGVDPYFFNNKKGMSQGETLVLVTEHRLRWGKELLSIAKALSAYQEESKMMYPLLIVCPEISGEARSKMVNANASGKFLFIHCEPEGIATEQKQCMKDIAAFAGAEYLSEELGILPTKFGIEHTGQIKEVTATKNKTIIYPTDSDCKSLRDYLSKLKATIETLDPNEIGEKRLLEKSLARLTGGFATIKAGGATDSDRMEIIDRIDDALCAVNSAKEEGIVPGGGVALIMAKKESMEWEDSPNKYCNNDKDIESGFRIILNSVEKPMRQILQNADNDNASFYISKILKGESLAYSIEGKEIESKMTMSDFAIIDPVKVIRTALQISASVAGQMLQMGAIITRGSDDNKK